ncbi:DUF637 domain-containing protein [Pseudomonas aeruginosa]|nr:DUF637 domain-containing protein [Pseudomonas aeruginosa]
MGAVAEIRVVKINLSPFLMHALMGGLAAQVSGGDFATGAAAAGANEALVAKLDQAFKSLSPRA